MKVAKKRQTMAAMRVQIAVENLAWLPLVSLLVSLTWFLTTPNRVRSVAITTTVNTQVRPATSEARRAPHTPEPSARRKAMKAIPVTIGWSTITRVKALVESSEARLKLVLSI
jgi:hypothetical protein